MYAEPTSHTIESRTGEMSAATGHYAKRLADLAGVYLDEAAFAAREIRTARHCFGCTAGAGSSCGGTLAD